MIDDVCVIIPAYNPEEKLFLNFINDVAKNFSKIVVINDGSAKECDEIFEKVQNFDERIQYIKHSVNLGKGRALKTAFNFILNNHPDCLGIVAADCDGQHGIKDVVSCAKALKANKKSLILGVRDFSQKDVPFKSRYGNKLTRFIFKLFIGLNIKDTQTGLRAMSTELMQIFMNTKGERYEYETNMLIECKESNIPIVEVPISTIYIEQNQTSKFNPLKDSVSIYKLFAKYILASISSFVIDIILFNIFLRILNNKEAPNSILISTVLARILSSLYNFRLNAKVVFKNMNRSSLIKYIILVLLQMGVSAFGVDYLSTKVSFNTTLIKVVVDLIIFMVNFVVQREVIFNNKEIDEEKDNKMKKILKWIIAGIMLIAFSVIMFLVVNNKIEPFDTTIYNIVTYWTNPFLDNLFKVFTFFGSVVFIVGFCVAALILMIWMKDKKRNGLVVASAAIVTIINNIIKVAVKRERPLVRRLAEESSYSFPSGHTMGSVALYGIIIFYICKSNLSKGLKILFTILLSLLTLGIMVSRIYLGVHFASDVIAGALASIAFLIVFTNIIKEK